MYVRKVRWKSPLRIILQDADVEYASRSGSNPGMPSARLVAVLCSLGSRLLVQRPFAADLACNGSPIAPRQVKIGLPLDRSTHIGPHTHRRSSTSRKAQQYIDLGQREGARLICGGQRPREFQRGYFIQPANALRMPDNDSRLLQEIFRACARSHSIRHRGTGNLTLHQTTHNMDLVAEFRTSVLTRAHRVAAQLGSGLVSVNTYWPVHWMLPYGGYQT